MRDAEADIAEALSNEGWLPVLDGPLHGIRHRRPCGAALESAIDDGFRANQIREALAGPRASATPQRHHRQELRGEANAGGTSVESETCSHLQTQSFGEAPSEENIHHQILMPSPCCSPPAPGRDRLLGLQGHQAQAEIHLDILAGAADESAGSQSDFEHPWETGYEVAP